MKSASLSAQLDLLGALGDATRLRLCAVLAEAELSVAELTNVLELGQSKVSTHLARLKEHGLVVDRREGTFAYYRLNQGGMPAASKSVWEALSATLTDAVLERDRARATSTIAKRARRGWPERVAGVLDRHYSPGRTWESLAHVFAGLSGLGRVLDIGAGDGAVADMLAPHAERYVLVDESATMLAAAGNRKLARQVQRSVRADMHALPFAPASFSLVLSLHVLTYSGEPKKALFEAARVLSPGGRLALATLNKHDQLDVTHEYGHVQAGFSVRWLKRTVQESGLHVVQCGVSARESKRPHFEVITCFAEKA